MNPSLVLGMGWFQLFVRLEGWNGSILCLVGGTGKDEIKAQSDTAMVGSTAMVVMESKERQLLQAPLMSPTCSKSKQQAAPFSDPTCDHGFLAASVH